MKKELLQPNNECRTETHKDHLCYLMSQGFNLSNEQEFNALIKDAKFRCDHYGRHAKSEENLCVPMHL